MLITLPSNQEQIEITKLKIFDLDNLVPKRIGLFTHTVEIAGEKHEAEFNVHKYESPPERPEVKEGEKIAEYSSKYWELHDYQLYQAALLHEKKKQDHIVEFYEKVKDFILEHCVKKEDLNKIETGDDWETIYRNVLVSQLTMEHIAETLDSTFAASFQGEPVLEALKKLPKGHGSINTIKQWEISLMNKLGISELEYSLMDVWERSRRVCSEFLPEIMSSLESEMQMQEAKKKSNKGKK